jgi:hypothetical protein
MNSLQNLTHLPCLDGEVSSNGLNSTQKMLFLGVYLICIPILIYCSICLVRFLRNGNCIGKETADAIIDECQGLSSAIATSAAALQRTNK